jgi:hypothetical protein
MTDEPDDWLDKDDDQWRAKRKVNQPKVSLAYITSEQVRINCIHEPPCAHCWTCRLADQMDADEQRHQKEIVDAGELHLADESTIYQLEQRTKELEADLHDMCMEAVNYRIKHGEAKARCAELEAERDREKGERIGTAQANLSYAEANRRLGQEAKALKARVVELEQAAIDERVRAEQRERLMFNCADANYQRVAELEQALSRWIRQLDGQTEPVPPVYWVVELHESIKLLARSAAGEEKR